MKIRAATSADIPCLIDLERGSAAAAHWTEEQYRNLFEPLPSASRLVLVAEQELPEGVAIQTASCIVGFLVAQHAASEWELENVVVSPSERRKGIGERLLKALLTAAHQTKSAAVFLEVRDSNRAARSLYVKAGFQPVGRRKSYYANPFEDAVLYRLDLS
jgi:[ribosomal protein S18]-alanine N-acetyltransferase